MSEEDRSLVFEFKQRLPANLKKILKRILIFGSRSTGKANPDSDLDIAVLVAEKSPEIEKQFEDIAYQVMWDHDFRPVISLKIFLQSQFEERVQKGFSFYRHVQQEGISV